MPAPPRPSAPGARAGSSSGRRPASRASGNTRDAAGMRVAEPSARLVGTGHSRRIGADAADPVTEVDPLRCRPEPVGVTRLADDAAVEATAQYGEKGVDDARRERERRRQLHQQRAEPVAEPGDVAEEALQRQGRADQPAGMRDAMRQLDREAEPGRRRCRPALVGRRAMLVLEGRIDLGCRTARGCSVRGPSRAPGIARPPVAESPSRPCRCTPSPVSSLEAPPNEDSCRQECDRRPRRSRGQAHQPRQAVLAGARHHQARPAPVLRRRRAGPAAAPHRSRDGDEALSRRRRGRAVLHEARADAAARRGSRPARSRTARATSSTSR